MKAVLDEIKEIEDRLKNLDSNRKPPGFVRVAVLNFKLKAMNEKEMLKKMKKTEVENGRRAGKVCKESAIG
ncbi:MAG: hypothetical protein ACLU4J_05305 [Butyricimonas paravirosa]